MSKYFEVIRKYYQLGLYTKTHLKTLQEKGVITADECEQIKNGK